MTDFFIDHSGGNDANDGTTRALARRNVNALTAAQLTPPDTIRCRRSERSSGESWTWPSTGGRTVTAPSGTAKLIDLLNATTGWVASANVTLSQVSAIPTINGTCVRFAIAAAFTTGKAAYKPVSLDLSTYTDVCHYAQISAGGPAGYGTTAFIDLCSDAAGNVPVVSIPMIGFGAVATGAIYRSRFSHGAPLPSNIQSIALRITSDLGAAELHLSNLFATKTAANGGASLFDAITPNSGTRMSSFVGASDERLYAIAGISADNTYVIGTNTGFNSRNDNTGRGYGAASGGAKTTYVWEGIPVDLATNTNVPAEDASLANRSVVEGGYDTTNMTTREAFTMLSDVRAGQTPFHNKIAWTFRHIVANSWSWWINGNAIGMYLEECGSIFSGTASGPLTGNACWANVIDTFLACGCTALPISSGLIAGGKMFNLCAASSSDANGSISVIGNGVFARGIVAENGAFGIQCLGASQADGQPALHDVVTQRNGAALRAQSAGVVAIKNAILNEATEFVAAARASRFYIEDVDGVAGNNKIYEILGSATRQTSIVNGSEPDALQVNPTSSDTSTVNPFIPLRFIWKLKGGQANTLTVATRRSNAGLSIGLRYSPCQAAASEGGLTSLVEALNTAANDTWQDISITLTPSADCIVGIELVAWGGTTFTGFFGKFRVS